MDEALLVVGCMVDTIRIGNVGVLIINRNCVFLENAIMLSSLLA